MHSWIVVFTLVAACGGKGQDKDKRDPAAPAAANAKVDVPKVATAAVLGTIETAPPFLVIVDASGTLHVSAIDTWADLAKKDPKAGAKQADLDTIDRRTRESFHLSQLPTEMMKHWDDATRLEQELAKLEKADPSRGLDDPPPPEEEDRPDDGEDESGGTGTAMALEEGKMGGKDEDRAAGQYRMNKAAGDPQLERRAQMGPRGADLFGGLDGKHEPNFDGTPSRLAHTVGEVIENGRIEPLRTAILAAPSVKAAALIPVIARLEGAIVVVHDGTVRPLRISFAREWSFLDAEPRWLEARVSANGIVIEAVPDVPIDVPSVGGLAAALAKAREARDISVLAPVDVLVDADVDAQRLVDVIVALDTAGVRMIGLGLMPVGEELARRGNPAQTRTGLPPAVSVGQPNAQGDLDKAIIRRYVKRELVKVRYCYEKALLAKPDLAGTVNVQFFIKPDGKVAAASALGVDAEVASCIARVIERIEFPSPRGGGGVQVNYPFTLRQ